MSIITFTKGDTTAASAHFKRSEFQCSCGCTTQKLDSALAQGLETLRCKVGSPISVTSGYRCAKHNAAVGGSSGSKHKSGQAADIKCTAINPVALAILAKQIFAGVGIYWYGGAAFVHVDTRVLKCTWLKSYSGESYRYTTLNSFLLPTIRKGSSGATNKAAVRLLQRLLGCTVDGVFGASTEKAVKTAQTKLGIKADGVCGPEIWRYISGAYKYM